MFTPVFVETAHLPTDPDEQRDLVARWHKAKTAHYTAMVADGRAARAARASRGSSRRRPTAGWQLAVASTSAEASVRAVLEHAVGAERAAEFAVFAGRRRAGQEARARHLPARAARARRRSRARSSSSRTAPTACAPRSAPGCATVVTVSSYTADEDFTGASLVVSSLGDLPDEPATVLADPHGLGVDGAGHRCPHLEHSSCTTP